MRKIVAGFACSLDGYIEGRDGSYDWILIDKEIDFTAHMKRFDAFFYGRKSYQAVTRMGPPDTSVKHYVFSNSLNEVKPGYTLIKGDTAREVMHIKNAPGKDIAVFGGAGLLASLLDLGLVDELAISFIPVLLGSGKPMVDVLKDKVWVELRKTQTYSNGTVVLSYKTKRKLNQPGEREA
jgi:dihydrofolate reductase